MTMRKRLGQRFLPYGANYLDWSDMSELRTAVEQKVLFRYQTESESMGSRLERRVSEEFGVNHVLAVQTAPKPYGSHWSAPGPVPETLCTSRPSPLSQWPGPFWRLASYRYPSM